MEDRKDNTKFPKRKTIYFSAIFIEPNFGIDERPAGVDGAILTAKT